ncbi:hypothetical protein [Cellvibrio japonicus]|uniref:Uncharacterized protein n=1 Tax=Cellvibrio japonicus (strain Ueda107) TaxID=498211 RepID=B3PDG2_CELJU|nr:hypothetical protein [Cellvibrio japonicus]ACE83744.1 hypothetical protein CJA_1420 [Cellvibrio japonicus Ueda107]QEI11986.1 hypothetical protein FY117_06920 [Cellvibrio japonicus]QEI15560.1 hypothetical protein FY116_06920 [Cellvibrio japonicus]QEI19139.1 hypothetical protein FY115_06920 [Cellvibrio japonicus]
MYKKIKNIVIEKAVSEFSGYALHDQFYKAGMASFWLYMAIATVTLISLGQEHVDIVVKVFVFIIMCTCTIGAALEFWAPIKSLFDKTWFKWGLGAISILVYKYSESQSDDFINQFTGIDPSLLPFSSSVLSVVYLPYSWLVTVSFVLSFYVIFHWFFIPFEKPSSERTLDGFKYAMRFMGLMVIFIVANNSVRFFEDPNSFASMLAKEIVLKTEYFPRSHCINVSDNQLSADIGRGYISVFDQNSGVFYTVQCDLGITNQSTTRLSAPDAQKTRADLVPL